MNNKKSKFILIYLFSAIVLSLAILFTTYFLLKGKVVVINPSVDNPTYLEKKGDNKYHLVVDEHYVENLDRKGATSFLSLKNSTLLETIVNNDKLETNSPSFDDIYNRIRDDKTVELTFKISKTFGLNENIKVILDFKHFVFAYIDGIKQERAYVNGDKNKFYAFVENTLNNYSDLTWFNNNKFQGDEISIDTFRDNNLSISNIYASLVNKEKLKYLVRFNENGGNLNNTTEKDNLIVDGKTIKQPDIPFRKGYRFNKWVLKDTNEEYDFTSPIKKNIELVATWDLIEYKAIFSNDIIPTIKFNYESEDIQVPNAEKLGYDFIGYEINSDGGRHKNYVIKHNTSQNLEFRPHFQPKTFKIKYKYFFYEEDGSLKEYDLKIQDRQIESHAIYDQQYVLSQTEAETRPDEQSPGIPAGFVFERYYSKQEDGTFVIKQQSGIYRELTDIIVYKKYVSNNYTITFNINSEGDITTPESIQPITKPKSSSIILPENIQRKGYTFKGWKKGRLYVQNPYIGHTNETFTAEWEKNTYTLTFNPKGGTWSVNSFTSVEKDNQGEVVYEIKRLYQQIVQTAPFTNREGYRFDGWFIEINGVETKLFENQNLEVDNDLYIYAKWTAKTYIIKYKFESNDNGDIQEKDINEIYTDSFSLFRPTSQYQGKRFLGWYIEGGNEDKLINDFNLEDIPFNEEVVLKAKWGDNLYVVTINTNGGEKIDAKIVAFNQKLQEAELVTNKLGQQLDGWYLDKELNNKLDFETYQVTQDITIHAKWINIRYNIEYELNGGTITGTNPSYYDIETKQEIEHPTLDGHDFIGWTIENKTTIPNPLINIYKGNTGNIKLIANFKPHLYTVTYIYSQNNTQRQQQIKIPYGYNLTLLDIDENRNVNNGFKFKGWYYLNEPDKERIDNLPYNDLTDIILEAKIELDKVKVIFIDTQGKTVFEDSVFINDTVLDEEHRSKVEIPGFEFSYWNIEGYGQVTFPYVVRSSTVFNAQLKPKQYSLRYYYTNTSYKEFTQTYAQSIYNDIILHLDTVFGYDNLGWFLYNPETNDFEEEDIQLQGYYNFTRNISVRQKLVKKQFTVVIDLNGAHFVDENNLKIDYQFKELYSYGDTVKQLPRVETTNEVDHIFSHWIDNENSNIVFPYVVSKDTILKPIFTNKSYTYTTVNEYRNYVNESYISGNNFLTLYKEDDVNGYVFQYWYYLDNGQEVIFKNQPYNFRKNMTFYAKYKKRNYLIQFYGPKDNNGVKENEITDFELYDTKNIYEYEELINPPNEVELTDLEFVGWSTWRDHSLNNSIKRAQLTSFPLVADSNKVFYAVYKPKVWKINYISLQQNGVQRLSTETAQGGFVKVLQFASSYSFARFKGWSLTPGHEGNEVLDMALHYRFGKDITLYAQYDYSNALIEFYNNINSSSSVVAYIDLIEYKKHPDYQTNPDHTTLDYDFVQNKPYHVKEASKFYKAAKAIKEEELLYPIMNGYRFDGYYRDYNNRGRYDYRKLYKDNEEFKLFSNYRLVAILTKKYYKIHVHLNDEIDPARNGKERVVISYAKYQESYNYNNTNISRPGYDFDKFTIGKDPDSGDFNTNNFQYSNDVHIWAQWRAKRYTISYSNMDDSDFYYKFKENEVELDKGIKSNINYEKYPRYYSQFEEIDLTNLIPKSKNKNFLYWTVNGKKLDKIPTGLTNVSLNAFWQNKRLYYTILAHKQNPQVDESDVYEQHGDIEINRVFNNININNSNYYPKNSVISYYIAKQNDNPGLDKDYYIPTSHFNSLFYSIEEIVIKNIGMTSDNRLKIRPYFSSNKNTNQLSILILKDYEINVKFSNLYKRVQEDNKTYNGSIIGENEFNGVSKGFYLDKIKVEYENGIVKEFSTKYYEVGSEYDQDGNQLTEKKITLISATFDYEYTIKTYDNQPYTLTFYDGRVEEIEDGRDYKFIYNKRKNNFHIPYMYIKGYQIDYLNITNNSGGDEIVKLTNGASNIYDRNYHATLTPVINGKKLYNVQYSYTQNYSNNYLNVDDLANINQKYTKIKYNEVFKLPEFNEFQTRVGGTEVDYYILDFKNPNPHPGKSVYYFLPGESFLYTRDRYLAVQTVIKEEVYGIRVHANGGTVKYKSDFRQGANVETLNASYEELMQDSSIEKEKIVWINTQQAPYSSPFTLTKPSFTFKHFGVPQDENGDRYRISFDNYINTKSSQMRNYSIETHDVPINIGRKEIPSIQAGKTLRRKVIIIDIFAVWEPKNPNVKLHHSNQNNVYKPHYNSQYIANYGSSYTLPMAYSSVGSKFLGWRIKDTQDEKYYFKYFVGDKSINPDKQNLDDYIYITDDTEFESIFEYNNKNVVFTDRNLEYVVLENNDLFKLPDNVKSIKKVYEIENIKKETRKSNETINITNIVVNGFNNYNHISWNNNYNNTFYFSQIENNILIVLANDPKSYTLKYNPSDLGDYHKPLNSYIYKNISIIPDSKLDKYDFLGWTVEAEDISNIENRFNTPQIDLDLSDIYGNLILTPHFKAKELTIHYTLNFNDLTNTNEVKYKKSQKVKATELPFFLLQPERRGYRFVGWRRNNNTYQFTMNPSNYDLVNDIYLSAIWERQNYTINYNLSGGSLPNQINYYNINSSFVLDKPTKKGSIFKGWLSSYQENEKIDEQIPNLEFRFSKYDENKLYNHIDNKNSRVGNITMIAVFENINYKITYNLNYSGSQKQEVIINYGETFNIPNILRPGYTLQYFSNGSNTFYPNSTYNYNYLYNLDLTARWNDTQYVIYFPDLNVDYQIEYGHRYDQFNHGDYLREPVLPNINEYVVRWYNRDNPDEEIQFPYQVTKNMYIAFEKAYKRHPIYYDMDGGINSEFNPTSYSLQDLNATNIRIENPTRYGYRFLGWSYTFDKALSKNLRINAERVYGPILIKAHWQPIYNRVTYDTLYHEEKYIYKQVAYEQFAENLTITNPEGYKFIYWYETEPSVPYDFTKPVTDRLNLQAYYHRYELVEKVVYTRNKPNEVAILFNRFVPYLDNTNYNRTILNEMMDKIEVINGRKPYNIYGRDNNKLILVFEPNAISENMIITLNKDLPIFSGLNHQVGLLKETVRIAYFTNSFVSYVAANSFEVEKTTERIEQKEETVLRITIKEANATVTPIFKFNSQEERAKVEIILYASIKQLNQFQYIIKKKAKDNNQLNITFTIELPELSQVESVNVTLQ